MELANNNSLEIIRELALVGSGSVSDIAKRLKLTWQDVSLHLNRLEKLGLIEVQSHISAFRGRRARVYTISRFGLLLIPFGQNAQNMSATTKLLLKRTLQTMIDNLEIISIGLTFAFSVVLYEISVRELYGVYAPSSSATFPIDLILMLTIGSASGLVIYIIRRFRSWTSDPM